MAVLKWLNFDYEQRKSHALDLMALVRFANMNESELFACYNPPILPELIELPAIKALMADAFNLRLKRKTTEDPRTWRGPRNYKLAGAYKPLELWCSLASAKASSKTVCADDSDKGSVWSSARDSAKHPAKDPSKDAAKATGKDAKAVKTRKVKDFAKDGRQTTIFLRNEDGTPETIDETSDATGGQTSDVTSKATSTVQLSPATDRSRVDSLTLTDYPTTSFSGSSLALTPVSSSALSPTLSRVSSLTPPSTPASSPVSSPTSSPPGQGIVVFNSLIICWRSAGHVCYDNTVF